MLFIELRKSIRPKFRRWYYDTDGQKDRNITKGVLFDFVKSLENTELVNGFCRKVLCTQPAVLNI